MLEQQLASNPNSSVWVSASAGTGKTKVLTDRVLRLLLAGSSVSKILCLTFTNAAAAEMKNRVIDRLSRWVRLSDSELSDDLKLLSGVSPDDSTLRKAKSLFAVVLDAPGGLKIQTIHSFCSSILGRFPLEAKISPNFVLLNDRKSRELLLKARENILLKAHLDQTDLSDVLNIVSTYVQDDELLELLGSLVSEKTMLEALLRRFKTIDQVKLELQRIFNLKSLNTEEELKRIACEDSSFDKNGLLSIIASLNMQGALVSDINNGQVISNWISCNSIDDRVCNFDKYFDVFLTSKKEVRAKLCGAFVSKANSNVEIILSAEALRLQKLMGNIKSVKICEATSSILQLGIEVLNEYQRLKNNLGVLDYNDLVNKTRELLTRSEARSWVLYKLDGGLEHVLIDEAQDTNPEQWEIISSIIEELLVSGGYNSEALRTVFGVGDHKQAIYGFQRAEVEGFERQRKLFSSQCKNNLMPWADISLDVSFRSVPVILSAIDSIFSTDAAKDGVSLNNVPIHHLPYRMGDGGVVEVWPLAKSDVLTNQQSWALPHSQVTQSIEPDVALAYTIADKINFWLTNKEILVSRGTPITEGDILILVRRRTKFVEVLIKSLKEKNIAVAGADRLLLNDHIAIMDLLALARFVLLPEDDLNLAALLKSPLFGLNDDHLIELCYGRNESLFKVLKKHSVVHYKKCFEQLNEIISIGLTQSPFEFFTYILGTFGGKKLFLSRLGPDVLDPLDEFLNLSLSYEQDSVSTLQGFVQWMEGGEIEIKRDPDLAAREVKIMTVHGAKGLQAPIVFLADTAQVTHQSNTILWPSRGEVPIWSPRKDIDEDIVKSLKLLVSHKEEQEYRRLLYVALTRAADRLYICGWQTKKAINENCWYQLIVNGMKNICSESLIDLKSFSSHGWVGSGYLLNSPQIRKFEKPDFNQSSTKVLSSLPDFIGRATPVEMLPNAPLSPSRISYDDKVDVSPLDDKASKTLYKGVLVHKLLELLPGVMEEKRIGLCNKFLSNPKLGLSQVMIEEIFREVFRVFDNFPSLFGHCSYAEVPVVGLIGNEAVSGVVDRLVIENDYVLIVDFKSNRLQPLSQFDSPRGYLLQMALYKEIIQKIYPDKKIKCSLLWTSGVASLQELSDDLLKNILMEEVKC